MFNHYDQLLTFPQLLIQSIIHKYFFTNSVPPLDQSAAAMTINTNTAGIDLGQNALCYFGIKKKKKALRLSNTLMTNWEEANKVIPI